jgi:beta-glucosidase-like glycosyl hydrolase
MQMGQDSNFPATNFDAFKPNDTSLNKHVNVQGYHYKLIREIGSAATVLLKNQQDALPLNMPKTVAVIGGYKQLAAESPLIDRTAG